MNSRTTMLAAIRAAAVPPEPPAHIPAHGATNVSLVETFVASLDGVGGSSIIRQPDQSIHELAAAVAEPGGSATTLQGLFAVAENGAVYVDAAGVGARTDVVIAEHLVLVISAATIVATMHEAVRQIPANSRCGWFLSGPSKTADIEQSLVIGAQGARTLHVIIEP